MDGKFNQNEELGKILETECAGMNILAESIMLGFKYIFEDQAQVSTQGDTKIDDKTGTAIPVSPEGLANPQTAEVVNQKVKEMSQAKQNLDNAQQAFDKEKDEFKQVALASNEQATNQQQQQQQTNPTSV